MKLPKHHCERCSHNWIPRKIDEDGNIVPPIHCPRCKTPYWDKPRQKDKKTKKG